MFYDLLRTRLCPVPHPLDLALFMRESEQEVRRRSLRASSAWF